MDNDETFSDWEDIEDDEESPVQSLFDDEIYPSISDLIQHEKEKYGFDLLSALQVSGNDMEGLIRIVNFIRWNSMEHRSISCNRIDDKFISRLNDQIKASEYLNDSKYMIPALQNDTLLLNVSRFLCDSDNLDEKDDEDDEDKAIPVSQSQNNMDKIMLEKYRSLVMALTSSDDTESSELLTNDVKVDDSYFDSYSHFSIHETMLKDETRTKAYAKAMLLNSHYFQGKTVLDVGCGTGILSLFAAKAGARKVIGVDNSSIIELTRKVNERNGFSDIISLIHGDIEDSLLKLGTDDDIDIIVSEWMGYGLFFENMLESVLFARDNYLSEDGILLPSHSRLFIECLSDEKPPKITPHVPTNAIAVVENTNAIDVENMKFNNESIKWLENVYGFDMSDFIPLLTREVQVEVALQQDIISNRSLIHELDLKLVKNEELDFVVPFESSIVTDSHLRAFVITFDVIFNIPESSHDAVVLSTSVQGPLTHWKHSVLWLEESNIIQVFKQDIVHGTVEYRRRQSNTREYDIIIHWRVNRHDSSQVDDDEWKQSFILQ